MALPLPLLRAAWRRQIAWGALAALALASLLASSAPAAPSPVGDAGAVLDRSSAPPEVGKVVRSNVDAVRADVDSTVANVREAVRTTAAVEPVASVVEGIRARLPSAVAPVDETVRSAVTGAGAIGRPGGDAPSPGRPARHADAGAIGDADSAAHRLASAAGRASSATAPGGLTTIAMLDADAHARPAGAASSTSAGGGDGDPTPDGPGTTTGGISGPLGFVLIAAVLAFVFGLAPRIISTPLRMSPARGHEAALTLPLERPD